MVSAKVSDTAGLLTAYSNSGAKNNNSQGINFTDILKKNTVESTKTVDANESIQVEETKENYKTDCIIFAYTVCFVLRFMHTYAIIGLNTCKTIQ